MKNGLSTRIFGEIIYDRESHEEQLALKHRIRMNREMLLAKCGNTYCKLNLFPIFTLVNIFL